MFILCRRLRFSTMRSKLLLFILITLATVTAMTQLNVSFTTSPSQTTTNKPMTVSECWKKHCPSHQRPRLSLTKCHVLCGSSQIIWPKPTGMMHIGQQMSKFRIEDMRLNARGVKSATTRTLLYDAFKLFKINLYRLRKKEVEKKPRVKVTRVDIVVELYKNDEPQMTLETEEGYKLTVERYRDTIAVYIAAAGFFGARHAMETLSQLIWCEESDNSFNVVHDVAITDEPKFKYRGLMIDTARNFMPMSTLRRTVNGMSSTKLNTLHLHLTDSHSFPLDLKKYPKMSKYGAYSKEQVFTGEDLKELTRYALVRGVRIVPEVDAPAHAGVGWQWGEEDGLGKLAVCVESDSWTDFCGEPPCGQLNPVNENTYKVLQGIYEELIKMTNITDLFHFGGDEVNTNCWMSIPEIFPDGYKTDNAIVQDMITRFHKKAFQAFENANEGRAPSNAIVWSSSVHENDVMTERFPPDAYIIQEWGPMQWGETHTHVNLNYRVIISNVDAWYMDCGYGSWIQGREQSCQPISSWQNMYNHRPWYDMNVDQKRLILGGEACLWSEKVSHEALDARLWPRASAVAERLWTDEEDGDDAEVTVRLALHRERLVERGIAAEAIWPEWCNRHLEGCYERRQFQADPELVLK